MVFDDPLFKNIPTSILLTMHNSKREKQYLEQIMKFKPTRTVLIQINQGYKNCNKPDWVNSTMADLWHANIAAFEHVNFEGPLLVLEDDVEFTDYLHELNADIDDFIVTTDFDIYSLGSLPYLSTIASNKDKHIRIFCAGMTHAVIYSTQGMRRLSKLKVSQPHDTIVFRKSKSYVIRKPCAIQSFERTENFESWGSSDSLAYMQLFEKDLFPIHSKFLYIGGIYPFVLLIVSLYAIFVFKIMRIMNNKYIKSIIFILAVKYCPKIVFQILILVLKNKIEYYK